MNNRVYLFFIIFVGVHFLCSNIAIAGSEIFYDEYFFRVLNSCVEGKATGKYRTIDSLFELKKNSREKNQMLIELLDYYLGSGPSEILQEFITEEGKKMIPMLQKKYHSPVNCLPEYREICLTIEERNIFIKDMINAIKKGVVLKAAE